MANKSSFTAEEWSVLRSAPHVVGMAISSAGGGIFGAVKEAMSAAQILAQNAQSSSELIRSLCTAEETKAAEEELRQQLMADPITFPAKLKEMVTTSCSQAIAILNNKSAEDVAGYRELVTGVAEGVAKAAKEGGFLGIGGEVVSAGESTLLSAITTALKD